MKKKTIVVVGGGASGLFASILMAQQSDHQVIIVERCDRVGRKLLATGNGRCNITNRLADESHYYSNDRPKVGRILQRYDVDTTLQFFSSLGIMPYELEKGRIYPRSLQASAVLDVLREECKQTGVIIQTDARVSSIIKKKSMYQLKIEGKETIEAEAVLLAAGGKSSPNLGSDGSGFSLLQTAGHTMTPLYPALVQMKTETEAIRSLKGIKFDGEASLWCESKCLQKEQGEILFTEDGLSGLPIFGLSVQAGEHWRQSHHKKATPLIIQLNFLPEMTQEECLTELIMRASYLANRELNAYFTGLLNKRIGLAVLKKANVLPLTRTCDTLSPEELKKLVRMCQCFSLCALGNRPFAQAQATAGGALLQEFDETLQSKKNSGLFASGEVLDVVGDCGGFNLQWAWSSAGVAAEGILQYLAQR